MNTQETLTSLSPWIEAEMARLHIPGVAFGILDGGEQHSACFGVTNLENPLPVDAQTLFQIGSIRKTITATAMMLKNRYPRTRENPSWASRKNGKVSDSS